MSTSTRIQPVMPSQLNGLTASMPQATNFLSAVGAARFPIFTAGGGSDNDEEIEWVVDKLLPAGSVTMVFGDAGTKKTYVMLDLCVCVSIGKEWLGFRVTKSPVLFIDEECGKRRLRRRMKECLKGHDAEALNPAFSACSYGQLSLNRKSDIASLRLLILELGARLVIIDSWIASTPDIENENDSVKVHSVLRTLRHLAAELEIAIVIVDHTNRNNGYRGSTAKKGGVDCMLRVASKSGCDLISFDIEKARDTEPFKFAALAHFSDGDSFYLTAQEGPSGSTLVESKWDAPVLNYLGENGESTIRKIAAALNGLTESAARNVLGKLGKENKVVRANDGGRGRVAIYKLL